MSAIFVRTPGLLDVEASSQHRMGRECFRLVRLTRAANVRGCPESDLYPVPITAVARGAPGLQRRDSLRIGAASHDCSALFATAATATGWEHGRGRSARAGLTRSIGGLTGYGCGADAQLRARFRAAAYGDRRCPAAERRIGKSYGRPPAVPTVRHRRDRRARQAQWRSRMSGGRHDDNVRCAGGFLLLCVDSVAGKRRASYREKRAGRRGARRRNRRDFTGDLGRQRH
jgi:hypothetical protein